MEKPMGRKPRDFNEFLHDLDNEGLDAEDIPLFEESDLASLNPFRYLTQDRHEPGPKQRKTRSR